MRKLSYQKGFTLAEIIIVITIFVLIIIVVFSAYSLSQQSYQAGERAAEVIQNGRVILERITREIRQAREIVTELPTERVSPPSEIKVQDGHLSLVYEEATARGGSSTSVTLDFNASSGDDYYKDMFIIITGGTGAGQIRKIGSYDGTTKIAQVEEDWDVIPGSGSTYKIDSSFYYVHYYRDNDNYVWRKIITYCFSEDYLTCIQPEVYIPWNATPQTGQTSLEVTLESPRIIGEYVTNLEFWGSRVINISLTLEKKTKSIELETKIFGRNL